MDDKTMAIRDGVGVMSRIVNLRNQAVELSKDGNYGVAVSDNNGEFQAASTDEIFYAWLLVNADNVTEWVIAHNGAILHEHITAPAPYADYNGGETQYRADLATLQEAGMLIAGKPDNAWVLGDMSEIKLMRYSHDLMRALSRFMPYVLTRLDSVS